MPEGISAAAKKAGFIHLLSFQSGKWINIFRWQPGDILSRTIRDLELYNFEVARFEDGKLTVNDTPFREAFEKALAL